MKLNQLVEQSRTANAERFKALEDKAKRLLKRGSVSITTLADGLDCSPKSAKEIVQRLVAGGYNVQLFHGEVSLESEIPAAPPLVVNSKEFFDGTHYKFGVLGETHLCNRHARLDVLNALYDIYEREGIKRVFHSGNIVDGEISFNRHELLVRSGFEPQVDYLVNEYPQRKGIETWFITGEDHEGWWIKREGINVGERMEQSAIRAGRTDLKWIGHVERDIRFKAKSGESWMRIMHPGGGSAYAISYTEQKIVESFQGGEKPRVLFVGHYHKFNQGYPREVHTVQVGCVCDQTAFLRRQKISVAVGGCIVDFHQGNDGIISRLRCEWIPFFDRGFYEKNNKYQTW